MFWKKINFTEYTIINKTVNFCLTTDGSDSSQSNLRLPTLVFLMTRSLISLIHSHLLDAVKLDYRGVQSCQEREPHNVSQSVSNVSVSPRKRSFWWWHKSNSYLLFSRMVMCLFHQHSLENPIKSNHTFYFCQTKEILIFQNITKPQVTEEDLHFLVIRFKAKACSV